MMKFGVEVVIIGILFQVSVVLCRYCIMVVLLYMFWMIFISVIIGIGLKKCMLVRCLGWCSVVVIWVIEIEEVLLVRMYCVLMMVFSLLNSFCLVVSCLMMVFIIRCVLCIFCSVWVIDSWLFVFCVCLCVILFLLVSLLRLVWMLVMVLVVVFL